MLNFRCKIFLFALFFCANIFANDVFNQYIVTQNNINKQNELKIKQLEQDIVLLNKALKEQQKAYDKLENLISVKLQNFKASETEKATQSDEIVFSKAYKNARNFIFTEQYQKAIMAFKDYIKAYPNASDNADSYFWLANAYMAIDSYDKASESYLLLQKKYPDFYRLPEALYKLATAQNELGKIDQAIRILQSIKRRFATHAIISDVNQYLIELEKSKLDTTKINNQNTVNNLSDIAVETPSKAKQ